MSNETLNTFEKKERFKVSCGVSLVCVGKTVDDGGSFIKKKKTKTKTKKTKNQEEEEHTEDEKRGE